MHRVSGLSGWAACHISILTRMSYRLTQSETTQPEYKAYEERIEKYGVRFRGVLTIETLDWLQHAAIKHISKDIHLRHVALHLKQRGDKGARSLNTPTLQKIYQSSGAFSQKVKIVIQCTKILPALYLTYGTASDLPSSSPRIPSCSLRASSQWTGCGL